VGTIISLVQTLIISSAHPTGYFIFHQKLFYPKTQILGNFDHFVVITLVLSLQRDEVADYMIISFVSLCELTTGYKADA
jgi:hypothetical protein